VTTPPTFPGGKITILVSPWIAYCMPSKSIRLINTFSSVHRTGYGRVVWARETMWWTPCSIGLLQWKLVRTTRRRAEGISRQEQKTLSWSICRYVRMTHFVSWFVLFSIYLWCLLYQPSQSVVVDAGTDWEFCPSFFFAPSIFFSRASNTPRRQVKSII
jgi:hypothetical protein